MQLYMSKLPVSVPHDLHHHPVQHLCNGLALPRCFSNVRHTGVLPDAPGGIVVDLVVALVLHLVQDPRLNMFIGGVPFDPL